jgi:hypothetical protein
VRALICLSTPFIDVQFRSPESGTSSWLLMSLLFWAVALFLVTLLAGLQLWLGIAVVLVPMVLFIRQVNQARPCVEPLLAKLALPQPVFSRLLIIRSPHDEAAIGLTLAQVVHVTLSLWRRFEELFGYADSPARGAAAPWEHGGSAEGPEPMKPAMLTTFVIAAFISAFLSWRYWHLVPVGWHGGWKVYPVALVYWSLFVTATVILASSISVALVVVAGIPFLLINSLLLAGVFGIRDLVAASLYLEVGVEPIPPGTWQCCQLPWPSKSTGLFHSLTYQDPKAVEQVGTWLQFAQEEPRQV